MSAPTKEGNKGMQGSYALIAESEGGPIAKGRPTHWSWKQAS